MQALRRLVDISIMLTSETNLSELLKTIVTEARLLLQCDGGTIYLIRPDGLHYSVSQSGTLQDRMGDEAFHKAISPHVIPVTLDSLVGFVTLRARAENVADVYSIDEEKPYRWSDSFDRQMDYRTESLLTLPLQVSSGEVLGVLQLVNCQQGAFPNDSLEIAESLAATASAALANAQLNQALRDARVDTIMRMARCAEFRDKETSAHIQRMSHISEILARRMGLSKEHVLSIKTAAPMHDVGKIGIPDAVLQKPGPLDDREWTVMKTHTLIGGQLLSGSDDPIMHLSAEIALNHHEKWNGKGYPYGKRGEEIPLSGRIVAVADVFDALMSKRCYKDAMPMDKVLQIITEGRGEHFQPEIVDLLLDDIDEIAELYVRFQDDPNEEDLFKINVIS
jgi:HD-GYP domain-containing protein (c-di-GMP phosphodiesterase class II)